MTHESVAPPANPSEIRDTGQSETGPRANGIRPLEPLNLTTEGSGPMHIVPVAESTASTPLDVSRMSRTDACPDCCINVEAPYRVVIEAHGFRAYYACLDCGYFWNTGWMD